MKIAISDLEGLTKIRSNSRIDTMSSHLYSGEDTSIIDYVYSTSLDRLFEQQLFDRIDFLKIDGEGSECKIMNGLSDLNLKQVKKIAIEVHVNQLEKNELDGLWNRLISNGFKGFNLLFLGGELCIYTFWREGGV
jgi:hypothetical protein